MHGGGLTKDFTVDAFAFFFTHINVGIFHLYREPFALVLPTLQHFNSINQSI